MLSLAHATKKSLKISPRLKHVVALPCEIKTSVRSVRCMPLKVNSPETLSPVHTVAEKSTNCRTFLRQCGQAFYVWQAALTVVTEARHKNRFR